MAPSRRKGGLKKGISPTKSGRTLGALKTCDLCKGQFRSQGFAQHLKRCTKDHQVEVLYAQHAAEAAPGPSTGAGKTGELMCNRHPLRLTHHLADWQWYAPLGGEDQEMEDTGELRTFLSI